MAFTTQYAFEFVRHLDLGSGTIATDITGLAGGGVAALGDLFGHSEADVFGAALSPTGAGASVAGVNGSLDQLANGDLVIAGEAAGDISYRITTASGASVLGDTAIGEDNSARPDVAALAGGGFVIASQDHFDGSDYDIDLRTYDSSGAITADFAVDVSSDNDQGPAVAGLADGGYAVAWTKTLGDGRTQAWSAVYNADGSVRSAPAAFDAAGAANTGMSVVALNTGGFAVAYQDTEYGTPVPQITLARFAATGGLVGKTQVTTSPEADTQASLTTLSNGLIAVSYSILVEGDNDVFLQLVDPATGARLLDWPHVIAQTTGDETGSSAAAWGLAGVAVAYQGGVHDVGVNQLVRTSSGDGADDVIVGDDAVDRLFGGLGDDILLGYANADILVGNVGHDDLRGGGGDDLLNGGLGDDVLDGGLGADTVDYSFFGGAVSVDLGVAGAQDTGAAGVDRLSGVETLRGGAGADSLTGDGFANRLLGGGGLDTLSGGAGADTLDGGAGYDTLLGGSDDDLVLAGFGADAMSGGSGVDTLDYRTAPGETFLDLGDSAAQNTHSSGADTVIGFENVLTGDGADRLIGAGADNRFEAAGGADTIKAKDGADVIFAGAGDDQVNGGAGGDWIDAGLGHDQLRGGLGADVFDFNGLADSALGVAFCDLIRDFRTVDGDRIDLSDIPGDLVFIGGAAVTGGSIQAEVRVGAVAQGALVQVDITADGVSDMDILVSGAGLNGGAGDFIL